MKREDLINILLKNKLDADKVATLLESQKEIISASVAAMAICNPDATKKLLTRLVSYVDEIKKEAEEIDKTVTEEGKAHFDKILKPQEEL